MGHVKIVLAVTLTMAITIAVTAMSLVNTVEEKRLFSKRETPKETLSHWSKSDHVMPQRNRHKKFSRFLMEKHSKGPFRNPNAADHCNKNPKICDRSHQGGVNSTMACCGNKCVDLTYDDDNCGACKKQCKFTQTCCRGQCVYLAYDKRHCGQCNHRCPYGEFCVYGLCNYA